MSTKYRKMKYETVKKTSVTRTPRNVIAVSYEYDVDDDTGNESVSYLESRLIKWHITVAKSSRSGKWKYSNISGDKVSDFWTVLYKRIEKMRSVWIITTCVQEVCTVLGLFGELTSGRCYLPEVTQPISDEQLSDGDKKAQRPGWLAIGANTEIISCRMWKTDAHIVGYANYGNIDIMDIIRNYGNCCDVDDIRNNSPNRFVDHSHIIAPSLANWYTSMVDEWRSGDCGMWGHTASQLSHSYWKRKYANCDIVKHQHIAAHKIERACLFGGRADVYRHGDIYDNVHHVDCTSMYPYLLSTRPAPSALSDHGNECSVKYLSESLESHTCAARVLIDTQIDQYPLRTNLSHVEIGRDALEKQVQIQLDYRKITSYPIGQFVTTLCGIELKRAIERGHVKHIYEYCIYRNTTCFQPFMQELMETRQEAKRDGDMMRSDMYKLLANSFAGKWARKPGGWITDKHYPQAEAWGTGVEQHYKTGEPIKIRTIGFVPQYWRKSDDEPSGCPIILAWLTSEGRYVLSLLVMWAGSENVYATNTDGLYVSDKGLENLRKVRNLFRDGPGGLRLLNTHKSARFWTPRHYRLENKYTMAGFAEGWRITDDGYIEDFSRSNIYQCDSGNGPEHVRITRRRCRIAGISDTHRVVLHDGTTRPYRSHLRAERMDERGIVTSGQQLHLFS